jgi:tetratricopeptide (TPR) repeat protein
MSGKWNSTCQTCGLILPAQAQRCPQCAAPVISSDVHHGLPGSMPVDLTKGVPGDSARPAFLAGEQQAERPLHVVLSLASDVDEERSFLSSSETPLLVSDPDVLQPSSIAPSSEDAFPLHDVSTEIMPLSNALLLPLSAPEESEASQKNGQRHVAGEERPLQQIAGEDTSSHWLSLRLIWAAAIVLALLFGLLFFFARSTTSIGAIAPDWGLASFRMGLVAVVLSIPAIILWFVLWRAHARHILVRAGVFALVLIVIGAAGLLSAAPLHRLQGQWFEARGQYGLALNAYQLSGDTVATNQTMARIAVEWAEELSAHQQFGAAVTELQPVVASPVIDESLGVRARQDIVTAYLAWGNQAQQQQAFQTALTRYQALGQAAYCDASCEVQVHAANAQALLGLAQQLAAGQHYDQAVAAYRQLVSDYIDTPEGQEAQNVLSMPQSLKGRLIYPDTSPAANFEVLLASQWTFDSGAQVLKLEGQQYQAKTDVSGAFSVPSVAVGNTYMIAWVDTNGHSGTCITTNNQPLYTVHAQPLRVTDAGAIDIECA